MRRGGNSKSGGGRGRRQGGGLGMGCGQGRRRQRRGQPVPESSETSEPISPSPAESGVSIEPGVDAAPPMETPAGHGHVPKRPGEPGPVAHIDQGQCALCGVCVAVCPSDAIKLTEDGAVVNADACCGCGACVQACPTGAITIE